MNSPLAQIAYRWDVVKLKASGRIPQFGWSDVAKAWFRSCDDWPTERFAVPSGNGNGLVSYGTPIGPLSWLPTLRRYTGLLALEHMRGEYEKGGVRISPGDVVIDLGGNIGDFTRYAFTQGASQAMIFEPIPDYIRCIEHCFAKEIAQGRLHLIRAAAWKEKTTLRFEADNLASHVSDTGTLTVSAETVDGVVDSLGLKRVDFIKADIEGAERVMLEGARKTIARFAPKMALCTYHLPDDPAVIPAMVQSIRPYRVAFNVGCAQAFFHAQ